MRGDQIKNLPSICCLSTLYTANTTERTICVYRWGVGTTDNSLTNLLTTANIQLVYIFWSTAASLSTSLPPATLTVRNIIHATLQCLWKLLRLESRLGRVMTKIWTDKYKVVESDIINTL